MVAAGRKAFVPLAVALLAVGCVARIDSAAVAVDPLGWAPGEEASVVYVNADTLSLRTLDVVIRYGKDFRGPSLGLNVRIEAPDSSAFAERVVLGVARRHTAASLSAEVTVPYRTCVRLEQRGSYRFIFSPLEEQRGIRSVGIRLSKE